MLHNLKFRLSGILHVFGPSAFAISIILNIFTILRLQHQSVDDKQYSYIGNDHPIELPLDLEIVALTFEDSKYYSTSGLTAWSEWNLLDHFQQGHGFVRLGANASCLQKIRLALINGPMIIVATASTSCDRPFFAILILPSSQVYTNGSVSGSDGLGVTHICRDWSQVYAYIEENQRSPVWAEHKTEM
ncbi:uncharacterized protein F5891DRAFT_1219485 [Suillus fuscotomentosus]|uniref:Uncharacterized protein n=1 Tax=Suillus fuscotomentosus TaxID=1912939 RepID=A0AAD4DQP6_9AGAM|nr:uncharacterized protein F5891DRAFT_1219485 [Suillus fuscotomentosus]KAG1887536.1 hypothetical protein F5891DRAFT_1219485 [Suillus fuscotomentosus]